MGCEIQDLTRQAQVEDWAAANKPEAVFGAAAKVGGILANDSQPAEFIYDNLAVQTNNIDVAHRSGGAKAHVPRFKLHLSQVRTAAHG